MQFADSFQYTALSATRYPNIYKYITLSDYMCKNV